MKISHRSHPIIEKLHNGSLGVIPIRTEDKEFFDSYMKDFVHYWKLHNKDFSSEINVITKPFAEAAQKAKSKLSNLYLDIINNSKIDFSIKGCYIHEDLVYMVNYESIGGTNDGEIVIYMFNRWGNPIGMYINSTKKNIHFGWVSMQLEIACESNTDKVIDWILLQFREVIVFSMFKSYAQVETKILLPNSKTKGILCKYVNQTKLKLTYLDSKWFTNLVKSDGFNVRGHFRLQPMKKNGEWTKELIWIAEFEKTGYTAPARKIAAYA